MRKLIFAFVFLFATVAWGQTPPLFTVNTTAPVTGGQAVRSGGTFTLSCPSCISQAYTTVDAAGTPRLQRNILNFTSTFNVTDNVGATRTDVDIATGGITNPMLLNSSITIANGGGLGGTGSVSLGGTLTLNVNYGTTAGTATQGNDTRLSPTPSQNGNLIYDTGSAYATVARGATNTVLHGNGAGAPSFSAVANADLTNSSVTVNTSSPLGGGGSVALGGTLTLTCSTCVSQAYTTVDAAGTPLTQRNTLNFSSTFATTDNVGLTRTDVDIATAGITNGMLAGSISNAKLTNSSINFASGDSSLTVDANASLGGTEHLALNLTNPNTWTGAQTFNTAAVIFGHGATATGSTNFDLTGSSGAFLAPTATLRNATNQLTLGVAGHVAVISSTAPAGASNTLTIPDTAGADTFVFNAFVATLTNKTISGASNTLTNIGNASLVNSSVTVNTSSPLGGGGSVALGGTLTLTCSSCITQAYTTIKNSAGTAQTQRSNLKFGSDFSVADSAPDTTVALSANTIGVLAGTGLSGGGTPALGASATISMPNVGSAGTYTFATGDSTTTDAQGRVSAFSNVTRTLTAATGLTGGGTLAADRSFAVDQGFSPTWTGSHTFNNAIVDSAIPTLASNLVNKTYVDVISSKAPARLLGTSNIASLSGTPTIDGTATVAGDRVLLIAQTTTSQNGVWVVQAGAWARPNDMQTGSHVSGAALYITSGAANLRSMWSCASLPGSDVVDTNALVFAQIAYFAGTGLTLTGSTFSVNYGTTAGTATQGNDTRLPPAPTQNGNIIYDTGSAYATVTRGATNTVLHGNGAGTPSFSAVANADLTNSSLTINALPFTSGWGSVSLGGSLSPSWSNESANVIFAGPSSGGAAAPTWRSLVAADLPGGTIVNSVSNSDGTLTISPTTGAVVSSINLGHANTWSATQTFPNASLTNNELVNSSLSVNAGAGLSTSGASIALGGSATLSVGGTADATYSTGAFTWSGASGKAMSLVASGAAMVLTADASSTWKTTTGNLTVDAASSLLLGTVNATTTQLGRAGQTTNVYGLMTLGSAASDTLTVTGQIATDVAFVNSRNSTVNVAQSATDTAGHSLTVIAGAAGSASASPGTAGGQMNVKGANGGAGTGSQAGGAGGAVQITGGVAGTNGGVGSGTGGSSNQQGGNGAAANGASAGTAGGQAGVQGGTGGAGSASAVGGNGARAIILGGTPGADNGGGGGTGGAIVIESNKGADSTGGAAGASGAITIAPLAAGAGFAGTNGTSGGTAAAAGAAGLFTLNGGNGGVAAAGGTGTSGSGAGGGNGTAGGGILIGAGTGGNAGAGGNTSAGGNAGVGGNGGAAGALVLGSIFTPSVGGTGGAGGTVSAGGTNGNGGNGGAGMVIDFVTGRGGAGGAAGGSGATGGTGGASGAILLETDNGGNGGAANGGTAGTGGVSGNITISTGNAGTGGNVNSGSITIDTGTATGAGTVGTVTIATVNGSAVTVGKNASTLTINAIVQTAIPYFVGNTITAASTIAPTAYLTHIGGTGTINTITPPTSFNQSGVGDGGCLVLIPNGLFTTGITGNIAIATTAIVSKALMMCFDHATLKWYPSY